MEQKRGKGKQRFLKGGKLGSRGECLKKDGGRGERGGGGGRGGGDPITKIQFLQSSESKKPYV